MTTPGFHLQSLQQEKQTLNYLMGITGYSLCLFVASVVSLECSKAVPDRVLFNPSKPSVDVSVSPEDEYQIGPLVTHSFNVLNNGPSPVSQAELFILWPLLLDQDKNDSYLLYLIDVTAPNSVACDMRTYKDPLGILRIGTDAEYRKRRSQRISRNLSPDTTPETTVAECENDIQICIHCRLQSFTNEAGAEITVISRLYERTLVKKNIKELNVSSVAVLIIPETDNLKITGGNLKQLILGTQITRLKPLRITKPQPLRITKPQPFESEACECEESVEIPVWVIILVVIGTALLLIATVAVLWRLGFFKRPKKEQLEREKRELAEHGDDVNNEGNAYEETDTQV